MCLTPWRTQGVSAILVRRMARVLFLLGHVHLLTLRSSVSASVFCCSATAPPHQKAWPVLRGGGGRRAVRVAFHHDGGNLGRFHGHLPGAGAGTIPPRSSLAECVSSPLHVLISVPVALARALVRCCCGMHVCILTYRVPFIVLLEDLGGETSRCCGTTCILLPPSRGDARIASSFPIRRVEGHSSCGG